MADPHNAAPVIGLAIWIWIAAAGITIYWDNKYKQSQQLPRQRAQHLRTIWKWALWPIYLPIFLTVGAVVLLWRLIRIIGRSIRDMHLFTKLEDISNKARD